MAQSIKDLLEKDKWEVRALGEIATDIYNGSEITRTQLNTGTHPAIKCGDLNSKLGPYFTECISYVDDSTIKRKKYFSKGDLLVSNLSNKLETVGSASSYLGEEDGLLGLGVTVVKHDQNPKYLSCAMSSEFCRNQIHDAALKGTVVNFWSEKIKQLRIPLPPRHVQDLIGNFLYELIQSTTELSEKLKRENGDFDSIEMGL